MQLEIVIGLEIHAQISTKSKLFSPADNDAFGAEPNTRVNEIDMGFPGTLPVINQEAVQKGMYAAAALGCTIQKFSKFDRKNYFYPDLPFGYQISQYDQPISTEGRVEYYMNGKKKAVRITRMHLENDAGKLTHTKDGTLCDYNRAGTPLMEIVTEPDIRSAEEAQLLAKEIQKILRAVDASDADMEKGMMRFDASISLRPMGEKDLYPRSEIKNLNSFTSLFKALNYEIKRQTALWEKDTPPAKQTTVGWLDDAEKTVVLRDKEDAHDYRYFPEPDLPPLVFTQEQIDAVWNDLPELPLQKYDRYRQEWDFGEAESLKLSEDPKLSTFLDQSVQRYEGKPKKVANLILSIVLADPQWKDTKITPEHIGDVLALQDRGRISSSGAKDILVAAMKTGEDAESLMKDMGLEQVSDSGELEKWVEQVLAKNPESVSDYKEGKEKAIQYLMGQVMKLSGGSANPPLVLEMLKKKLS